MHILSNILKGLALGAALLVAAGGYAAQMVKVTDADGHSTEFALADTPTISYNADGDLLIQAAEQQVTFPGQGVYTCTIVDGAGIAAVAANTMRITITGIEVAISGAAAHAQATAYALDGKIIAQAAADAQGCATLQLPKGVAIICINNQSFKVKL